MTNRSILLSLASFGWQQRVPMRQLRRTMPRSPQKGLSESEISRCRPPSRHEISSRSFPSTPMTRSSCLTSVEISGGGDLAYTSGTYVAKMMGEDGVQIREPGKWLTELPWPWIGQPGHARQLRNVSIGCFF